MAVFESEIPVSYSRFLVSMRLSCLVSEIFACDRQTGSRTTRTITIAGHDNVALAEILSCELTQRLTTKLTYGETDNVDHYYSAVVLNLGSRDPLGVPNANLGGPKRKSGISTNFPQYFCLALATAESLNFKL